MPLHRIITVMQDKTRIDEIVYSETTNVSYKPIKGVVSRLVQCFKYSVTTDVNPSVVTLNGKRMIVPSWQEVHPLTTINDIKWIKPQRRPRADISVKTGDGKYKTTFNTATGHYKCNCFGFYRAKDRRCKHIKELKASLQG